MSVSPRLNQSRNVLAPAVAGSRWELCSDVPPLGWRRTQVSVCLRNLDRRVAPSAGLVSLSFPGLSNEWLALILPRIKLAPHELVYKSVVRYFRPESTSNVTTVCPGPSRLAIRIAATTLAPEEVPAKSAS